MKKYIVIVSISLFIIFGVSANATAIFINPAGGESNLQEIIDNITEDGSNDVDFVSSPGGGDDNDALSDSADSYWEILDPGGSVATFIIEIAGNANYNSFGIYDHGSHTNTVELFSGADGANDSVTVSFMGDGSVMVDSMDTGVDFASDIFGYYLGGVGATYYSDTELNADGNDHMAAFQGLGVDNLTIFDPPEELWVDDEYILAWEDVTGGDQDFNDMVVLVDSVTPIPEPATLFLVGGGLLGLAGFGKKKMKKIGRS